MDAKEARAAVADARRNEDGTVTLHAVEDGGHVYPYPATTIHVRPTEAVELLQFDPPAYTVDSHKREDRPKAKSPKRSPQRPTPTPAPEPPTEPEGATDQVDTDTNQEDAP